MESEIVVIITRKGGGVLLRRKDIVWSLPSIQFEANASARVLAYQLVRELTSVQVHESDLRLLMVNHHGGGVARVIYVFELIYTLQLLPHAGTPDEWEFWDVARLPLTLVPEHNEVILSRQTGARYTFFPHS